MNPALDVLLHNPAIWRGDGVAPAAQPGLPTGFPELDRALPGGGWPRGALTEILTERQGIGEVSLLLPALARLSGDGRAVVFVAPPFVPYAPALASGGVDLARFWVVSPGSVRDAFWAAEQALRCGACGAVLLWSASRETGWLRRLQAAAQAGDGWGVLYRPAHTAPEPSPAPLRLRLEAVGDHARLHILKRRGGVHTSPLLLDLLPWCDPPQDAGERPGRLEALLPALHG